MLGVVTSGVGATGDIVFTGAALDDGAGVGVSDTVLLGGAGVAGVSLEGAACGWQAITSNASAMAINNVVLDFMGAPLIRHGIQSRL